MLKCFTPTRSMHISKPGGTSFFFQSPFRARGHLFLEQRKGNPPTERTGSMTIAIFGPPPPVRGKIFPLYGPLCGADLFW